MSFADKSAEEALLSRHADCPQMGQFESVPLTDGISWPSADLDSKRSEVAGSRPKARPIRQLLLRGIHLPEHDSPSYRLSSPI